MLKKQITLDTLVRGLMGCLVGVGLLYLLYILRGALTPFLVAWLIAYLLFPLVKFLQYRCRLKYRAVAIVATFLIVAGVIWGGFLLIVPPMVEETMKVKDLLVAYVENDATISSIPGVLQDFVREHLNAEQLKAIVTHESFLDGVKATVPKIGEVISQSLSMVSGLLSGTMILLYTLFILLDYEQISGGWLGLLPEKLRHISKRLVDDVSSGMNKYFRGQAVVALCVGILFSIGFLIIDFPMAIGLGLFIGLLNMVPYLQIVGLIPTVILAIVKSADTGQNFWVVLLMALAVFAVVQTIQDVFLTPKIMGKVTGLNSAIILLSLSIWGSLMGMLGMIIALPMTTLLLNYYQQYVVRTKDTKLKEN